MSTRMVDIEESMVQHGSGPVLPRRAGALRPLGPEQVRLIDGFWADRQRMNADGVIPHADRWVERVGWVDNFRHAVDGTIAQTRRGREFSDSDVYKLLEAMAWEYGRTGAPWLDARIREVAALVGAVQEPDGYLSTRFGRAGQPDRYSDLEWGHELYCYGHLVQAAVARLRTGVHDELVEIALRAADHVCAEFGENGRAGVCGHPEIEPALVELYRATGRRRYLDQARIFLDRRGTHVLEEIEFGREYFQDDVPIRAAPVLRGHAVRALYLAAGAVDVAIETGDDELLDAVVRQYRTTLACRTYLTGGMGSHHQDEAYGEDYELPPDRAYSETCAGIGSVMTAWRLTLATGDLAWGDVIERALYNVVATSPSRDGDAFFYTNPLQQRTPGTPAAADAVSPRALAQLRAPWFEVSCCPTNVARTLAQLAGYVATVGLASLQLHQLLPAHIEADVPDAGRLELEIRTRYPDEGEIQIQVLRAPDTEVELAVRIPAWSKGRASLDGVPVAGAVAIVRRTLQTGDLLVLQLDVAPRVTTADPRIDAVRGCVAVERGPLVMCAESVDLDGLDVGRLSVNPASLREVGGRLLIDGRIAVAEPDGWPYASGWSGGGDEVSVPLHPYHDWAERGPSTMRVWLPTIAAQRADPAVLGSTHPSARVRLETP